MKAYTCQIGRSVEGEIAAPTYSETLHAYSLIEAIDKARAVVHTRPAHEAEDTVRLLDPEAELDMVWSRPLTEVREG